MNNFTLSFKEYAVKKLGLMRGLLSLSVVGLPATILSVVREVNKFALSLSSGEFAPQSFSENDHPLMTAIEGS